MNFFYKISILSVLFFLASFSFQIKHSLADECCKTDGTSMGTVGLYSPNIAPEVCQMAGGSVLPYCGSSGQCCWTNNGTVNNGQVGYQSPYIAPEVCTSYANGVIASCSSGSGYNGYTCESYTANCNIGDSGCYSSPGVACNTFTPPTDCQNVSVSNVTQTTAKISWNCANYSYTINSQMLGISPDTGYWDWSAGNGAQTTAYSGYGTRRGLNPSTAYTANVACNTNNAVPTGYCTFRTLDVTPYTVTTNPATSITANGATLSFAVSGYTGTSVSSAGSIHLYQADGTTHINNYTTSPATVNADGTYTASLSSLTCNTTYQFRGEAGSTYGSKLSFTTSACPGMTVAVTNSPATTTYGQNVSLNYTVTNIPSGQTATCGLYDWTGNNAISGVSSQTLYAPVASNGGLESASIGSGSYAYTPTTITNWSFGSGGGVANDGGSANAAWGTDSPEGTQTAFIQGGGSGAYAAYSTTLSVGTYTLNFKSTNRTNAGGQQTIAVMVDGVQIFAYSPAMSAVYAQYSPTFTITTSGAHTVSFTGQNNVGDNTAFVDDVVITPINGANSGMGSFTFNPSPSTLPVNPSGYGYVVKCSVPTPATTAQANATVYVAVDPTPTLTLGVTNGTPGQMSYQCNNSTGVLLKTTGGNVQSLTSGQYVYASATTPQTLVDLYSAKFKYDTQTQSGVLVNGTNFFFDRNNSGGINTSDILYVNARPLNVTVSASFFSDASGPQGYGVLIGPDGYMYVSDTSNDRILKRNPNDPSSVSVFHSSSGTPTGMVFDSAGNLYVSHYGLSRIVKITPGGVMTTFVPSISRPIGLAFDNAGNLFVTRQTDGIVNKVTPAGVVSTFASGLGNVNGIVINPNNNYVYVASQDTGNVYQITPAGAVSTYASGFSQPIGLTMDRTTSIYVSGLASGNISKIAPGGAVTTIVSGLTNPNGMAITSTGNMFIGLYNGPIYKTTILDTFPQTITGSFPVVQGATYALDCYGSFGTLPATTTYTAVDLNVGYASSTAMYPHVLPMCPSDSTSYSVSRSPSWSSAPYWASGSIWALQYDTNITSGSATTTYNYTLNCYKNNGNTYTGQVTNSINVPPAVTVTSLNAPVVASGTTATVTWKSDGNSCDLKNYNGSATWAGGLSGTPITGGYQYTYVMSPNNPNFTWLKSSRMGVNAVGWMVTCKDTTQGARLPASASSNVQVFNPTTATIIPPDVNGNLVFKCTPDFDYMDIKRNNISLSGYPKTWNTNQTSNYSVTLPNLGGVYELVCKSSDTPGNIDTAIYPGTGLQVYGSIGGSAASIPTTAVVTGTTAQTSSATADGTFSRLNYVIANATTWSVNYYTTSSGGTPVYTCTQAGGCDSAYSAYRLNSGSSEVSLYSSAGLPNTPFTTGSRWVITASDGVSTKTLTLILTQSAADPNGSITVVPNPAAGVDIYNFTLRCENSLYYNLYNMSYATTTAQGRIVEYNSSVPNGGTLSTRVTYTAVNSNPSASSFPLRFECVGAPGTNTFVDTRNVPILSKSPANVQKFTVYPSTVLCGGGQVALAWKINNPRGKNCTITTDTIKPVSAYPAALQSSVTSGIQAIKSKLDGSNIVIKNSAQALSGFSTTTAFGVVDSENNNTAEIPRIPLRDPTKFILSCYNDGATTTVTVEARTACQGEQ